MTARALAVLFGILVVFAVVVAGAQPGNSPAPATSTAYANSWALVIGVSDYQRVARLNFAATDARDVQAHLKRLGFPDENIRVLLDRDATLANIFGVLYRDFAKIGPDDRLLVYFAGHGETVSVKGGQEGFLLPWDADPSALAATAISMDEVGRIGQRVRAKHVLFVMDACFSGLSLTRDISVNAPVDIATALRDSSVQVLAAGRKGEPSIEVNGHGLFTARVLEGLRGAADTGGRGFITANDLAAYVVTRVAADSRRRMTPQYSTLLGAGQFVFELAKIGSLAVTATRDAVDLFVDDVHQGQVTAGTPFIIDNLDQRSYRLRAQKSGFRRWEREVHVVANQRIAISVDMEPLPRGSLAISARVDSVELFLDDERVGQTKPGIPFIIDIPIDRAYRLRAQKSGFKGWEREIRVAANERKAVTIDIEPLGPSTKIRAEDGAEMVLVPGGEFTMGTTTQDAASLLALCKQHNHDDLSCRVALAREQPDHRVVVDPFYIDRFEVTIEQFARFVASTSYRTTAETKGTGWVRQAPTGLAEVRGASWRQPEGDGYRGGNVPVTQVSWHDAQAYCSWAGKRLPTEAEWEKAARGPNERWFYPWGNSSSSGRMKTVLSPVGTSPSGASPYGAEDMASNVWEWVKDWFERDYYGRSAARNPAGPDKAQLKLVRGGSWAATMFTTRVTYREPVLPDMRSSDIGFRCATDRVK